MLSYKEYECDCSNTGYVGSHCEYGVLTVPEFSQMKVGVRSEELYIRGKPNVDLIIDLSSEGDKAIFTPKQLKLIAPRDEISFTITPRKPGVIKVKYTVSGRSQFEFLRPRDGVIYAVDATAQNRMKQIPDENFMNNNCKTLNIARCENAETIKLESNCPWKVSGTNGYAAVAVGSLKLPMSLAGIKFLASEGTPKFQSTGVFTAARETQEMLKGGTKQCLSAASCSNQVFGNAENHFIIKRNLFARAYHTALTALTPWWVEIGLPHDYDGFHVNDVQSMVLKAERMKDLSICANLPKDFARTYAVFITHAPISMELLNRRSEIESAYAACTVVDLCNRASFLSLPYDKSIDFTSGLRGLNVKMLSVNMKGIGFSAASPIKRKCLRSWNGITEQDNELCINATVWMKTDTTLNTGASKTDFTGEMFADASDLAKVCHTLVLWMRQLQF